MAYKPRYTDETWGNLAINHHGDLNYLLFWDLDDAVDRVKIMEGIQKPWEVYASRHHALGHALTTCFRDYVSWVGLSVLLNHPKFFCFQCVKFLRPTEGVRQFFREHHLRPLVRANINGRFRKDEFLIDVPLTPQQRDELHAVFSLAYVLGMARKTTLLVFALLLSNRVVENQQIDIGRGYNGQA